MRTAATALCLGLCAAVPTASAGPWAAELIAYNPGLGPEPGYTNGAAALGGVSTYTGEAPWAGPVTMFNAPYLTDQIVSIGPGGSLVVKFDMPVANRPGEDLVIYGNAGFVDPVWDDSTLDLGVPAALYGADGAQVEVSPDGATWLTVTGAADSLFPTQPWKDTVSTLPADFSKPMPAGLTLSDFDGLSFADALALYDGSAGGTAFDISATGWTEIEYVRVSYQGLFNAEIDAIRAVPEPGTLGLMALGALTWLRRRP